MATTETQPDPSSQPSIEELVDETLAYLAVRPDDGALVGDAPSWFGDVLFGGFVVAQAVSAAACWAPAGSRVHSLHAYFLRPMRAGAPVRYEGGLVREGRAFASARFDAVQDGKQTLSALCSYTADTEGYEYDQHVGDRLPPLDESTIEPGPGPWVASYLGPTDERSDGTYDSTYRTWFRIPAALPDDVHVHVALLAFASDWTGTGGRPLLLDGDTTGMVSLDHAVWFHRPWRADEWLFYDVHSLVNGGGRGLLRGVMRDETGRVVVSMAQEMRLLVVD